jgi:hypothetical protein
MFEQLHAQLASAIYTSTWHQQQIAGLVDTTIARVAALGVNLNVPDPVPDPAGAISPAGACMLATAHCTNATARDLIAMLAGQLAELQAGSTWSALALGTNASVYRGLTPQGRTVANTTVTLAGSISIGPGYLLPNATLFTAAGALTPSRSHRIPLAFIPPTTVDPVLTIALTGVVTIGTYLEAGLVVNLDGSSYQL